MKFISLSEDYSIYSQYLWVLNNAVKSVLKKKANESFKLPKLIQGDKG